jgi:hypothetical protein
MIYLRSTSERQRVPGTYEGLLAYKQAWSATGQPSSIGWLTAAGGIILWWLTRCGRGG